LVAGQQQHSPGKNTKNTKINLSSPEHTHRIKRNNWEVTDKTLVEGKREA
jgi:hypothetical protein